MFDAPSEGSLSGFGSENRLKSPVLQVMARAALEAARGLRRDFGELERLQRHPKGAGGIVTAADIRAEEVIYQSLKKARPDYGFLMEERGEVAGEDPDFRWIVDPLDGTRNFAHAIPHFAISIALEEKGVITAGVIYQPLTGELFHAERGGKAFVNGERIRVSSRRDAQSCLIAGHGGSLDQLRVLLQGGGMQYRRLGALSLDLAYVAAGRLDGFFAFNAHYWDLAAGMLLVREAGGVVGDAKGGQAIFKNRSLVAGTSFVHEIMCARLREVA